jgi:hypothetical protein
VAHGVRAGKMFIGGRRGLVRFGLVAQRGWGGGEADYRPELDSTVMAEGRSNGLN